MRDLETSESPSTARTASHIARWWEPEPGEKVHCYLCPRHCHIGPGQAGFCFIRANQGGKLYSLGYARPAALQIDPIEKKPLNHFLPGTKVFSLGTAGCNMGCFFCQNWSISKSKSDQRHSTFMAPEEIVEMAIENDCPSIAFTYNEPTIWGEYVVDICKIAHQHGLKTVMVSNGYVTYEAFHDIYDHIDAANIDLKAFTEKFYGATTLTHLQPVLDTLTWLKNETSVWFEITNLLIPTLNDAPSETRALCEWILENLGPDVPLHFTAFHPDFKLRDKPRTPDETLHAARAIAIEVGLRYVYEGNISTGNAHTNCPSCNSLLIRRSWHSVQQNNLVVGDILAPQSDPRLDPPVANVSAAATASADLTIVSQSRHGKTAGERSVAADTHRDSAAQISDFDHASVPETCSPDSDCVPQHPESNSGIFYERPISKLAGENPLGDSNSGAESECYSSDRGNLARAAKSDSSSSSRVSINNSISATPRSIASCNAKTPNKPRPQHPECSGTSTSALNNDLEYRHPQSSQKALASLPANLGESRFTSGRCPHCAFAIPGRWLPDSDKMATVRT